MSFPYSIFHIPYSKKRGQAPLEAARARSAPLPLTGQAALSLVFLIGGIILFIGANLAFLVFAFISSTYGFRAQNRAFVLAYGGITDGMEQLVRNKDFSNAGGYSVSYGTDSTTVIVNQNTPSAGFATITADAIIFGRERKLQGVASINSTTGEVHLISFSQLSL